MSRAIKVLQTDEIDGADGSEVVGKVLEVVDNFSTSIRMQIYQELANIHKEKRGILPVGGQEPEEYGEFAFRNIREYKATREERIQAIQNTIEYYKNMTSSKQKNKSFICTIS